MSVGQSEDLPKGPIGWMVRNKVTPNLLMVFLLLGGLYMALRIKQEVFPEFELDMVSTTVIYPGASPEEVERGIIMAVESAVRGIEGLKEVRATALEGQAVIMAEILTGQNNQKVLQDIKQAVDRITTFPRDAERPVVSLVARRREVLQIVLYGDVSENVLRETVEDVRDRLLMDPNITEIDLQGVREYRIMVDISQETLRTHGLTLQEVAQRIGAASVELPGGKLETKAGQIMLRIKDRREWARQFAKIPIITTPSGALLLLEDIARVRDSFEETERYASYNGKRSMSLGIYRVGDQTPLGVTRAAKDVMAKMEKELPPGVKWTTYRDASSIYKQRLTLLLKNAFWGLLLVMIVLGLFLELKLAFWVTMGIPTSFLGTILLLPGVGVSINMISMFAFIIALGIVVDDAIVAGENIYEYRSQGMSFTKAAILGARDVSMPIAFSILTNIVAFLPLYWIEGIMGKIWKVIPLVVITTFLISWGEALFILPAHLAHRRGQGSEGQGRIARFQRWVAGLVG